MDHGEGTWRYRIDTRYECRSLNSEPTSVAPRLDNA